MNLLLNFPLSEKFATYGEAVIAGFAAALLKPLPAELMDAHDVSPIVNLAKYDGPDCIRPVTDDGTSRGQLSLL